MGRPAGSKNKTPTLALRDLIDRGSEFRLTRDGRSGLQQVVDMMYEKAMGVTVQQPDPNAPGGQRIFSIPPDAVAAKLLFEQRFGRAKETVEITEKGGHRQQHLIWVPQVKLSK